MSTFINVIKQARAGVWLLAISAVFLSGCVTGKSVGSADSIQDTGKANIAVVTYDLKVYTTERYRTVKFADLNFRCEPSKLLAGPCFDLKLPYLGKKSVDGFELNAFEGSGSKVMSMKYGTRAITKLDHNVIVDRETVVECSYDKKKKRDVCKSRKKNISENHTVQFEQPAPVTVTPGSGCYVGHITLTMIDDEITDYNLEFSDAMDPERLTGISDNVKGAVIGYVNRPCT